MTCTAGQNLNLCHTFFKNVTRWHPSYVTPHRGHFSMATQVWIIPFQIRSKIYIFLHIMSCCTFTCHSITYAVFWILKLTQVAVVSILHFIWICFLLFNNFFCLIILLKTKLNNLKNIKNLKNSYELQHIHPCTGACHLPSH